MAREVTSPVLGSITPTFLTYFYFTLQWWSNAWCVPCANGTTEGRMALLLTVVGDISSKSSQGKTT